MNKVILISSIAALVFFVFFILFYYFYYYKPSAKSLSIESEDDPTPSSSTPSTSKPAMSLQYKYWIDYAYWIKLVFISISQNESSYEEYSKKLDSIAESMATELASRTTEENGKKYEVLLKEHFKISKLVMIDLQIGNPINELYKQWIANGEKIAHFIATWNPMYSANRLATLWDTHLTNLLNMAKAILTHQTGLAISYGDLVENQLIAMVSYLSNIPSK